MTAYAWCCAWWATNPRTGRGGGPEGVWDAVCHGCCVSCNWGPPFVGGIHFVYFISQQQSNIMKWGRPLQCGVPHFSVLTVYCLPPALDSPRVYCSKNIRWGVLSSPEGGFFLAVFWGLFRVGLFFPPRIGGVFIPPFRVCVWGGVSPTGSVCNHHPTPPLQHCLVHQWQNEQRANIITVFMGHIENVKGAE